MMGVYSKMESYIFEDSVAKACQLPLRIPETSKMYKAKILVLGPCQSGKTVISNYLSDSTETSGGDYHPTHGVRILEFETQNVSVGGRDVSAEIELWDVSGDQKFEACWPSIARETNGVLFVFNPDHPNHDKDLETWYNFFVDQQPVRDNQCTVFAHHKNQSGGNADLPSCMSKVSVVNTNLEDDGDTLRHEFTSFLGALLTAMSDKSEQEELSIMNSR